MTDTKTDDDKKLSVSPTKTLKLKRPGMDQATVRQNYRGHSGTYDRRGRSR